MNHSLNPAISIKMILASLLVLIFILLVFYIFQVNFITKASFEIPDHQKEISQISQENKDLEITLSQINSLKNIEDLVKNSNFERAKEIHYLRVLEGKIATK